MTLHSMITRNTKTGWKLIPLLNDLLFKPRGRNIGKPRKRSEFITYLLYSVRL
jgi:hypothetical protein